MKPVLALAVLIAALALPTAAGAGGGDTSVVCVRYDNSGDAKFGLKSEPRKCTWVHRREDPFGYNTVDMVDIKWKSWGTRKARGKGDFVVNMTGPVPGSVDLSKPEIGCGHRAVFTKATFIDGESGDRTKMRLDSCR